eukprot:1923806-Prymnesium_polylepis.1
MSTRGLSPPALEQSQSDLRLSQRLSRGRVSVGSVESFDSQGSSASLPDSTSSPDRRGSSVRSSSKSPTRRGRALSRIKRASTAASNAGKMGVRGGTRSSLRRDGSRGDPVKKVMQATPPVDYGNVKFTGILQSPVISVAFSSDSSLFAAGCTNQVKCSKSHTIASATIKPMSVPRHQVVQDRPTIPRRSVSNPATGAPSYSALLG